MMSRPIREELTPGGEDIQILSWVGVRAPQLRLRVWQGISAAAHVAILLLLVFGPRIALRPVEQTPDRKKNLDKVKLLAFAPDVPKEPVVKPLKSPLISSKPQVQAPRLSPAKPVKIAPEDLKLLKIDFDSDNSGFNLQEVMKKFDSQLAFASPEEVQRCQDSQKDKTEPKCFCHLLFDPRGRLISDELFSLSGFFLVEIGPPDPPFVTDIRKQSTIPPDFAVYALLPSEMRFAIEARVVQEAQRIVLPAESRVTSVEIAFKAGDPQGFSLKALSTAPAAERANTSDTASAVK